jgi:DNA-binding NtrC family response regulator
MADRRALVAVVIVAEGETEGLLVLPRASRVDPLTLEEVRALKGVADRLATACRARATEARMLARVQETTERAEASEQRVERLKHERTLEAGRHALAAARLARPATLGTYAATSRMALEAIERRAAVSAPIAIVGPSGVDPIPYLARVHLGGARSAGPLVLVDATSVAEHDAARWCDPRVSPLALADGGLLVLLDGAALPLDVQRLVARACAEARAPWERPDRLDVQLALTGVETPAALVAAGRLDAALASRLGDALDAPVHLPGLSDRPEDFRAILTDRLAREGLRALGRPVGIEAAAFARLTEYPFHGEDAELSAIVVRLVAACSGGDAGAPSRPSRGSSDSRDSKRRKDPISA